jgi:hypothetical protein
VEGIFGGKVQARSERNRVISEGESERKTRYAYDECFERTEFDGQQGLVIIYKSETPQWMGKGQIKDIQDHDGEHMWIKPGDLFFFFDIRVVFLFDNVTDFRARCAS